MEQLLELVRGLPPVAAYAVAAALVFAESGLILGLLLPGEATLLLVGFLCYAGPMRLVPAMVLMIGAALLGDSVAWAEGRRVGAGMRSGRYGRRVEGEHWARAERLLNRYGGRAVAVARFIAFARTLTPRLAGMSRLPYRRFLPWNLVGVLGSVGGSILLGYLAGDSYQRITTVFGRATGALLLFLVMVVLLVLVGRYLGRHREPVTDLAARLLGVPPLRRLHGWYSSAFHRVAGRFGVSAAVAVNLVLGTALLLGIGIAVGWLTGRLVQGSGLPLVDPAVERWAAGMRQPLGLSIARELLSVLRGWAVIVLVGAIGTALTWRQTRAEPAGRRGALASAGLFIPLLVLALAADWSASPGAVRLFPTQVTLVTAGFGMLAWMLSHRLPWAAGVAVWMVALGAVAVVGSARVYVGWNWCSEVLTSVLLGALWVLVFTVAWRTRERVHERPERPADRPLTGAGPPAGRSRARGAAR